MMCEKNKPCYLQNRELSWLMFDRRVLEEAEDTTVPLLERLRFISIFTSNLDEFFMVRVGSLGDLSLLKKEPIDNKTGMTVEAQLKAICKRTTSLYQAKDRVYGEVEMLLRQHGIVNLSVAELTEGERAYVERYFDKMIRPLLSPQIIDLHHPFPHIANKTPHIAVRLRRGKKEYFGMIPTASSLPRVIRVSENEVRYLLLETILLQYADAIFDGFTVMERAVFCVTRSADLNLDDDILDADSTYLTYMKRILKKRPRLRVVRLETDRRLSEELLGGLLKRLRLKRERVWVSRSPLEMSYVPRVIDMVEPALKKELTYPAFVPQYPDFYMPKRSIIRAIEERDRLLFYPYHTFDIFTELLREAMCDEAVISIKITVYRLAERDSKLAAYLIGAAEAGKDVTVLMELTARFDEQNNIDWAERLEAAGCRVLYGVEGVKVHGKICLIGRRCQGGLQYITQVGTGNYNEETARLYTDISLFTSNIHIGKEAALFFQNMGVGNLNGHYEHLTVAPRELRERLLAHIDREITRARSGAGGRIIFKINALTDKVIIDKLCEASSAGVRIDLIVRGICCLLPQVHGKTDNITVRSIVGRFLEHSRIYLFGEGEDAEVYLSSADLMTRNTERRVEIACPVRDMNAKECIITMLSCMLADTAKARILQSDGTYLRPVGERERIDCQTVFMQRAVRADEESEPMGVDKAKNGFWRYIWKKLKQT